MSDRRGRAAGLTPVSSFQIPPRPRAHCRHTGGRSSSQPTVQLSLVYNSSALLCAPFLFFTRTMGLCSCAPDRAHQSFLSFNGKAVTFIRKEREFQPLEPRGEADGIPCLSISGICDETKLQTAGTITPSWFLNCVLFLISNSSSLNPKSFSVGWMVNICCLLSWGQQLIFLTQKITVESRLWATQKSDRLGSHLKVKNRTTAPISSEF